MKGELIGINTAIATRTGGYQGIGFAIPTNMARPIMEALMKDGKVTRGYLGVGIATVSPLMAKKYGLGSDKGVLIAGVEANGPAARAGLVEGDVVTSMNGTEVKSDDTLRKMIGNAKPGTTAELAVVHRNGKSATVKAKLGQLPDDEPSISKSNKVKQQPQRRQLQQQPWQSAP
jgi:serine protease Do